MFNNFQHDSFKFCPKWVMNTTDNELKLLVLTSFCTDFKGNYSGTFTDMCNWLQVKSGSYVNKNLKSAIISLADKGFITYSLIGRRWTIKICIDEDEDIFYFRKCWLNEIRKYNKDSNGNRINKDISVDWIKLVRIFVYTFEFIQSDTVYLQSKLADELNMSSGTFGIAFKALKQIYLDSILIDKKTVKKVAEQINGIPIRYRNIGSRFERGYDWMNQSAQQNDSSENGNY